MINYLLCKQNSPLANIYLNDTIYIGKFYNSSYVIEQFSVAEGRCLLAYVISFELSDYNWSRPSPTAVWLASDYNWKYPYYPINLKQED